MKTRGKVDDNLFISEKKNGGKNHQNGEEDENVEVKEGGEKKRKKSFIETSLIAEVYLGLFGLASRASILNFENFFIFLFLAFKNFSREKKEKKKEKLSLTAFFSPAYLRPFRVLPFIGSTVFIISTADRYYK